MGNPQQQNQVQPQPQSDIDDFFNQVQDYIKNNFDIKEDELEKHIKDEFNQQAQINQDFYSNSSVEEVAEKIVNSMENGTQIDNEPDPNPLDNNEMRERVVVNFSDFVNESKSEKFANNIFTDLEVNHKVNIPTTNMDFIESMQTLLLKDKNKKFKFVINKYSVDITRIK